MEVLMPDQQAAILGVELVFRWPRAMALEVLIAPFERL